MMQTPPTAPKRKKQNRGPRPKHVPRRTCVSCRETDAKRSLTRIVRTPEQEVVIDPTGKRNGRGAYLCERKACWDRAVSGNVLTRALNVELTADALQSLREFAATLPEQHDAAPVAAASPRE